MRVFVSSLFSLLVAGSFLACVKAPNVSVVDSFTALEAQAAGQYPVLENDLSQAGILPRPEAIPHEALADGASPSDASLGEVAQLFVSVESDNAAIDGLLTKACIGEGWDGLLSVRQRNCDSEIDAVEISRLVGRANLHRRQIWQAIANERQAKEAAVADGWRDVHRVRVVCGALVQSRDGSWEPKEC